MGSLKGRRKRGAHLATFIFGFYKIDASQLRGTDGLHAAPLLPSISIILSPQRLWFQFSRCNSLRLSACFFFSFLSMPKLYRLYRYCTVPNYASQAGETPFGVSKFMYYALLVAYLCNTYVDNNLESAACTQRSVVKINHSNASEVEYWQVG